MTVVEIDVPDKEIDRMSHVRNRRLAGKGLKRSKRGEHVSITVVGIAAAGIRQEKDWNSGNVAAGGAQRNPRR